MGIFTLLLKRNNGTYYYRQRVPKDLLEIVERREIKKSLRTKDLAEAKRKCKVVAVEVDNILEEARRKRAIMGAPSPSPEVISARVAEVLKTMLDDDAQTWAEGKGTAEIEEICSYVFTDIRAELANAGEEHTGEYGQNAIRHIAEDAGLPLTPEVKHIICRLAIPVVEQLMERARGHWREDDPDYTPAISPITPGSPSLRSSPKDTPTLTVLVDKWRDERKKSKKTYHEYKTIIRRFYEVVGKEIPVSAITSDHVRAFKDTLILIPSCRQDNMRKLTYPEIIEGADPSLPRLAPYTIQKNFGALKTIIQYAFENGHIDHHPGAAIRYRPPKQTDTRNSRDPYSKKDLQAIFRATKEETGVMYWLPRLALYTGARLGELAQSTVEDIRQDSETRCYFLNIHADGEGRSLKTKSSKRVIPLHPDLIEIGFTAYVEERKKKKAPLWPDLGKPDAHGTIGGLFSKRYSKFIRAHTRIRDKRKVFHSFRHTFKETCRKRGDIAEDVHDALSGHAGSNSVSRSYGSGQMPMNRLWNAIQKLKFPKEHL